MPKTILLILLLIQFNFPFAQDFDIEVIEPESSFKELKKATKKGSKELNQLEEAFLKWDYKLLKPFLDKKIRKDTKSFFKRHSDSIKRYNWKKRTHYGPLYSIIPGGNFGLTNESNELRLHSTNRNYKVFEVNYSYCIKDSSLNIYSLESHFYPYKSRLNTTLPTVLKTEELIQSLRESLREKNVVEIQEILANLEKIKSKLLKLSFFKQSSYNSQMSRNYGNLSWYLIFKKQYQSAIKASEKALKYDSEQTWIYSNLALSSLLSGDKETAMQVYEKYKSQTTNNNKSFKEIFKSDLKEAKESKLINLTLYNEVLQKLNE